MHLYNVFMGTGAVHCNLLPQLQPFFKQPVDTGGPGGELMRLYDIFMRTGVVHCNLLPQLQPFLKQPAVQVDQEVS